MRHNTRALPSASPAGPGSRHCRLQAIPQGQMRTVGVGLGSVLVRRVPGGEIAWDREDTELAPDIEIDDCLRLVDARGL